MVRQLLHLRGTGRGHDKAGRVSALQLRPWAVSARDGLWGGCVDARACGVLWRTGVDGHGWAVGVRAAACGVLRAWGGRWAHGCAKGGVLCAHVQLRQRALHAARQLAEHPERAMAAPFIVLSFCRFIVGGALVDGLPWGERLDGHPRGCPQHHPRSGASQAGWV